MNKKDPKYTRLVNCAKWRHLRAWFLSEHPLCERCNENGIKTMAMVVHHINPVEDCHTIKEMTQRCYNPANLMALCRDCHHVIHEGYHTKEAIIKRTSQLSIRQINTLQGYGDTTQLVEFRTKPKLPTWEPPINKHKSK